MNQISFWIEAIVVGVVFGFLGYFVSLAIMYWSDPNFNIQQYHFWKEVVISYILTGILGHVFFEYVGLNKWYCKNGFACMN